MPGNVIISALTQKKTPLSLAMLPSRSALSRASNSIKFEDDEWYMEDWERLEHFLLDLKKQNTEALTVAYEKSEGG